MIADTEEEARKKTLKVARDLLDWGHHARNAEMEVWDEEAVELEPPSWEPKKQEAKWPTR